MNGTRGLIIATAAAFIVGCSVGLMGGILFMRYSGPDRHMWFMPGGMRGGPMRFDRRGGPGHEERMLPILERELGLTPEQKERIVAHIDRAREHHAAERESIQVWLDRELTPSQRERLKQMEARMGLPRHGPGSGARRGPNRP